MHKQSSTRSPVPADSYLYSVNDACAKLGGMGRTWLYAQIKAGHIRTVKLGARTMVPASEIERFVADAMQEAA